jgi:hypothetical protein
VAVYVCVQLNLLTRAAEALLPFTTASAEFATLVLHSGSGQVLLKAALYNPTNLALVKSAALLLANLVALNASSAAALKRLGALEFLIAALEASPFDDELIAAARKALKGLTAQAVHTSPPPPPPPLSDMHPLRPGLAGFEFGAGQHVGRCEE